MRKNYFFIFLLVVLICFESCQLETSITDEFYPYSKLEEFEGFFSQVTFRTSEMIYPKTYLAGGKYRVVAVINGFENLKDQVSYEGKLEIPAGIMAINSNAFSLADKVTELVLPTSCQSLGENSIPQRAKAITASWSCIKDFQRAIDDSNKQYLRELTITGNAMATLKGSFNNLDKVKLVSEVENGKLYWPSLPVLYKAGLYFTGWYDSNGDRIISGTKVTTDDATAVPQFSDTPPDEPITDDDPTISGGAGFVIPYILMATEKQYNFTFTNNKDGTYTIKPGVTEGVTFDTEFDGEKIELPLNESNEWVIQVKKVGKHTLTCFYVNAEDKPIGYAQVTFTADLTI